MSTLLTEIQVAKAQQVTVTDDSLTVDLTDGRTISAPLAWYPRLFNATAAVPAPASPFGPLSITVAKSKRRSLRHVPASCIADPPHSYLPVHTRSKPRRAHRSPFSA